MARRSGPGWRDEAASSLVLKHLPKMELAGPVLVMEDPLALLAETLESTGLSVRRWNRRAFQERPASPWPPAGPFSVVALRLPRAKEELLMDLHAAASVLTPGGTILVYGAKDEGVQGVPVSMADLFTDVGTVAVGGHCRVQRGTRPADASGIRGNLSEWREAVSLEYGGTSPVWVSYPGVFAHGRLDRGTRFLLDALPPTPPGARILDYGCGSGVVGYVARERGQGVHLVLTDVDAVALAAAEENVPGAVIRLLDGLPGPDLGPFHAIFSNPPFHEGKAEAPELLLTLIRGAPYLLDPKGMLVLVTQRRLPVLDPLGDRFARVEILAENGVFRVLKASGPKL